MTKEIIQMDTEKIKATSMESKVNPDSQLRPPTAALAEIFGKCRTNFGFVGNSGEK